jgi:hypothetical protein
MASGNFLGSTAMLLVLDDDEDLSSNGSAVHLQPAISNGTRPNFSFAEEDCYLCELGDESCDVSHPFAHSLTAFLHRLH